MYLGWVNINCLNLDDTIYFYEKILNLDCIKRYYLDENRELALIKAKNIVLQFIEDQNDQDLNFSPDVAIGIQIDNFEEWLIKLKKHNIKIIDDINTIGNVRFITIQDPSGMNVQLYEDERIIFE